MMEKWSRKFDWPARVQAHAAHLADIERKAGEAVAGQNGVDGMKRQEEHREDEWLTRSQLIALAREAIARWKKNEARCGTLEGIARLLDLASKLGRVSSGLSLEPADKPQEDDAAFKVQIEVALQKVYSAEVPPPTVAKPTAAAARRGFAHLHRHVPKTSFPVDDVHFGLDSLAVPNWNEIDAVSTQW